MSFKTTAFFDQAREDYFIRKELPDKPPAFLVFEEFIDGCILKGTTDGLRVDEEVIRDGQLDYSYSRIFTNIDDANQYAELVNQLPLAPLEVTITEITS